jgi:DNA-binding response OmpR family regulator
VLLDVMLPRLDGVQVLRSLAEQRSAPPVVAMSASPQHLHAAIAAGAEATLSKPFELNELLDIVTHYCSRGRSSR